MIGEHVNLKQPYCLRQHNCGQNLALICFLLYNDLNIHSWFLLQWSNAVQKQQLFLSCLYSLSYTTSHQVELKSYHNRRDLFPDLEGCGDERLWLFGFCWERLFELVLKKESVGRLQHIWSKITCPNNNANYMSMQIVVCFNTKKSRAIWNEHMMIIIIYYCSCAGDCGVSWASASANLLPTGHNHENSKF